MLRMAKLSDGIRAGSVYMFDLDYSERISEPRGHPADDLMLQLLRSDWRTYGHSTCWAERRRRGLIDSAGGQGSTRPSMCRT